MVATPMHINYCRIEKADNGYIVHWNEKESKPEGCLEHCEYIDHSKIYTDKEADDAWKHYRELKEKEWAYEKAMKG